MQPGAEARTVLFNCAIDFDNTSRIDFVKRFLARRDLYPTLHGTYASVVTSLNGRFRGVQADSVNHQSGYFEGEDGWKQSIV